jgi:fatty acid desaturase
LVYFSQSAVNVCPIYLLAIFLSYLFFCLSWHFFTNHFIKPLREGNDPLVASTSVLVPDLFNRLHFNFSYHTEHHVFPNINSDYYPLVSELLKERYSDRHTSCH